MTDSTASDDLRDAVAAWLDPGRRADQQTFPALVEARFEAETGAARSRGGGVIILASSVVMLLLWLLLGGVPAAGQGPSELIFLDLLIPFCGVLGLLLLTDPPPRHREAAMTVPPMAIAAGMFLMFHISQQKQAELNASATTLLLIFGGVVLRLRFRAMVVFTLFLMGGFISAMSSVTDLAVTYRCNLVVLTATACALMLLTNWRMNADLRRNYALNLREVLRHEELAMRNETLDALVRSDALTGLANRRAYDAWLQNCWLQARAGAAAVGLIVVDVDRFKAYNDFYGHAEGDACLQNIARALREQLRGTSDLVARLGGEEFAVLLPGLNTVTCGDVAERLRQAIATLQLPHLGAGGIVSISCGAASLPAIDPYLPADLFAAADAALYHAKEMGRNCVCLADPPAVMPAMHAAPATASAQRADLPPG